MLLVAERLGATVSGPNTGSNIEVAKPQIFDRATRKLFGFLIACKLFIRMRIRKAAVKEQIQ